MRKKRTEAKEAAHAAKCAHFEATSTSLSLGEYVLTFKALQAEREKLKEPTRQYNRRV